MMISKHSTVAPSGRSRSLLTACLVAAVLGSSLSADRIYLVSGDPLEEITIINETMSEVTYKDSERGKEKTVSAADVLAIDYESLPALVEEAENALAENNYDVAFETFDAYLLGHLEGRAERRKLWAPAYVANRLIELYTLVGDRKEAIAAADLLIEKFPESRYLPGAYMAKATALAENGDGDGAKKALDKLSDLIVKQDLPKRWGLECRLFKILVDAGLVGDKRRTELRGVETDAGGDYPTVRNRATVAIGESFLAEASQGDGDSTALGKAREHFEDVITDPSADEETLAGAYTGLGDCQYQLAATSNKPEDIRAALMTFMRVVVLYRDEVRYSPKAMFYAGRCFDKMGGEEDSVRAQKLYKRVIRSHPESPWAEQAADFK